MSPCCRTSATYSQVNPTPRWGSKRCSVQTDLHYTVAPITSKPGMHPEGCLSSFLATVQQRAQGSCPEASWDVAVEGIRMGNTPSSPTGPVWTWLQLCSPVIWCHLWPTSICKLFSEPCLTLSSFFLAFSSCVIVLLLSVWGRLVVSSFLPSLLIFTPSQRSWHFCLNASFFFPLGSKADWNWLKQFVLPWQGDVKTKHVCLLVLSQDFFSCSFPSFLFNRHSETGSWSKKKRANPPFLENAILITHPAYFPKPCQCSWTYWSMLRHQTVWPILICHFPPQSDLAGLLFEIAFATCLCHNCVSWGIWKYKSVRQPETKKLIQISPTPAQNEKPKTSYKTFQGEGKNLPGS